MSTKSYQSLPSWGRVPKGQERGRALDILRGITIAGMILVNNPGGGEENAFAPLLHAEWIGLTPTDLVFPFFMFIMGITTYLSLRKYDFTWSKACVMKILRRGAALWLIGLAITWLFMFTRGLISGESIVSSACCLDHIRILGVMPRLGICYAMAALVTISVKHDWLPWIIAGIFIAYYAVLQTYGGWVHDDTNICAVVDRLLLGPSHVYRADSPDPEGLLSTIPAIAHVLIGVFVGRLLSQVDDLSDKIERLFVLGTVMMCMGFLLSYGCPLSKKLWTPTFSLVTCGFASMLLAFLIWLIDKNHHQNAITSFFDAFGVNPLAMFIIQDLLLLPFSVLPLVGGDTVQDVSYNAFATIMTPQMASLLWALIYIAINWCVAYYMKIKGIRFKI